MSKKRPGGGAFYVAHAFFVEYDGGMERETERRIEELSKDVDRDYAVRMLGSLGLVDATLYDHPTAERTDSTWAENPNVFLSED